MYTIDRNSNRIVKLEEKTFTELGFRERDHLQEWLANNPEAFGEELLIIQKEFNGFNDTNERLDLLGLDKQGNLVIIENKLDDTGKDVTWQAMKYASYCSSLTVVQIKKIYQDYLTKQGKTETAEDNLAEFLKADIDIMLKSGYTQRIILVAGNFRKEVTSTVLWLMNYKLRIQCFKVTPFQLDNQLFLNIEQIIPMKGAEDYNISMADKTQEDINTQEVIKTRYIIRNEFWTQFLQSINTKTNIFQNINVTKDNWISVGSGLSGVTFNVVISNYYARAEVYIASPSKDKNKILFKLLNEDKDEIEKQFGETLCWEELSDKKASRIKYEITNVDYFNKEDWTRMIDFMVDGIVRLEKTFKHRVSKLKSRL